MSYLIDFAGKHGHDCPCSLEPYMHPFHGTRYSVYEIDEAGRISRCLFHALPKQLTYFTSSFVYVLFGGGRGPGKTEAIVWDAIFTAYLIPGSRQIIFRRTMGELKSTIIDRFKSLPEGLRGKYSGESSYERCELGNGSIIRFGSAATEDATRKQLSGEFVKVHFDEWSEWPYAQWKFIAGSARSTTSHNTLGERIIAQIKGATNPGGACGDVLNHLFGCDIEKSCPIGEDPESYQPSDYQFIKTLVDDNPAYGPDMPAGIAYRRMLLSMPRNIRDAWLYGKWSGFEGQYFDCFEREASELPHDTVVKLMRKQYWQPIWLGYDWGKTHFSYVTWNTFIELMLADGTAKKFPVTFRELLINGISETALAGEIVSMTMPEEIKRVQTIYGSPETFGGDLLSRAKRMGDVFVTVDLPRPRPAFDDRIAGWTMLYTMLDPYVRLEDAEPKPRNILQSGENCSDWLIDETCERLFEAIPWAMSSKKPGKDGDIDKEGDSPLLDVLDGARYGIASRIQPQDIKPREVQFQEAMASLPVVGSSRYIRGLQLDAEIKKQQSPFYTSRGKYKAKRH